MNTIRPLAFYLPQFHPIPENDAWWGKGFTEWRNVVKTKPLFKGHYQPHLPADLGFYDLRLIDTMEEQATMAKEHGIHGFIYYHYWFNSKQVLEYPVKNMIANKKPDFPFMLCWANENWSRNWDGGFDKLLLHQEYSPADDREHMEYLCKDIFSDTRYIKIDNKPVFAVYRTELFPAAADTAVLWNEVCRQYGFNGIYLLKVESFFDRTPPNEIGFDAAVEFQPEWANLPSQLQPGLKEKILKKLKIERSAKYSNKIFEYSELVQNAIQKKPAAYKRYPGLTPMWDNTARRQSGAHIFNNSTPELYGEWLSNIVNHFKPFSVDENFIFINAWNEWAEGNHLEPCQKWGKKYLEETKKVIGNG
jgi:lipopolysaccharide biosynthesis protein